MTDDPASAVAADVSFIMPCFNEEAVIGYTIPRLANAFADSGHRLQIVACDNGSTDRTGECIDELAAKGFPITHHRVEKNEGYGAGVLSSIPLCTADFVGIIPADGQVDAEDVVRVFESVRNSDREIVGKVRRRFRLDGPDRWVVSVFYNFLMAALWPGLGTLDVNGSPKVLPRRVLEQMDLQSKDWLLDPELMIKAREMGVDVIEMNVFSRMRESGVSHVQPTTMLTFLRKLAKYKFGGEMKSWKQRIGR